jgi:drug/metabolite transporter (DMT)-like permease
MHGKSHLSSRKYLTFLLVALIWGTTGVTAILFAAVPLATMLGSVFAFRTETFRYRGVVGILFVFLGIVVVFFDPLLATGFSANATLAVLYLGLAGSAAAFVMYYSLLETVRASTLSTISYVTPFTP